jgi:hypothetical protein
MDVPEILVKIRNALEIERSSNPSSYKAQKKSQREIEHLQKSIVNLEIYQKLKIGDWVTKGEEVGEIRHLNLSPGGMPVVWVQWVSTATDTQRLLPEKPNSFKLLGDNWNQDRKIGDKFPEGKIIGYAWCEKTQNIQAIVELTGILSCIDLEQLTPCSDTWIYSPELGDSPSLLPEWAESAPSNSSKLTQTRKPSCDRIIQTSPSTPISEAIPQEQENSTSLPAASLAPERPTPEPDKDSNIQNQPYGEKELDVSSNVSPNSALSNNLKELSDEDLERYLEPCEWQDITSSLKSSRQRCSELATKGTDYLLFPTLTACSGQTNRPAGQTRCEKWWRDKGLIASGWQLGTGAIALILGFPSDWFDILKKSNQNHTQNPPTPKDASEPDTSQAELFAHLKPRSLFGEFCISTPLLSPSKNELPQNGLSASKPTRRRKSWGSGYLFCKPVTINGKEYSQWWYQWEVKGVKRSKYVSRKLLGEIQTLEAQKVPVADILEVLGAD